MKCLHQWRKVPGALARQGQAVRPICGYESLGSTEFVGAVEVNSSSIGGVVAMDFAYGPKPKNTQQQLKGGTDWMMGAMTPPDPTCKHGLHSGTFCCPMSCNVCGGKTCATPPNIGKDCCVTAIGKDGRECDKVGPPCNMGRAPAPSPPDPAVTLLAKRAWFLLEEGFLSLTGAVSLPSTDPSIAVTLEQVTLVLRYPNLPVIYP